MTLDLKKMQAYGFGNKTTFFKTTFYAYAKGAMREARIIEVISRFKTSSTTFRSTYPSSSDVTGDFKFVFRLAGLDGTFTSDHLYLDPLREKEISVGYTSLLALSCWLMQPKLALGMTYHIGGALFTYNTIRDGAFVTRKGFISGVYATPDDVVVDVLTAGNWENLNEYDLFSKATCHHTISLLDKESVKEFTKTKEDIMAELSTKIVKFSDEEKRADDEKLNNVIGSLHAGIQALVNDYAGNYPVSVFIHVGGQTDRI